MLGPNKVLKGIYKFEGNQLVICYPASPQMPRPSEFNSPPNENRYIYVLERVK
jgi:hypothetical protein